MHNSTIEKMGTRVVETLRAGLNESLQKVHGTLLR